MCVCVCVCVCVRACVPHHGALYTPCTICIFISLLMAVQQLNPLSSPAEEQRLEEVLSNLRSEVKKRRLLMYPYYRDFDMVGEERGGAGSEGTGRGGGREEQ